ncbi:hypothetical protein [Mesorhizobium sp. L48C026A00]|uniref:hypothetical protein n=1 Tax=Mesorhizobium sp. L48C026A00 TaxID=1287182 RepID=UPI0003D04DCC|nr:hypothetical protein [Mesorhizobium sp. L48C026A00]ESZ05788.1 hypothetical protein X737_35520 [Mesorhizobium sp. L48C026A00]
MEIAHLLDMDGVLVCGGAPIEGSIGFVRTLVEEMRAFQIFTNNSRYTPEDHAHRLRGMGFPVEPHHIYTSALATAQFVSKQFPGVPLCLRNGVVLRAETKLKTAGRGFLEPRGMDAQRQGEENAATSLREDDRG